MQSGQNGGSQRRVLTELKENKPVPRVQRSVGARRNLMEAFNAADGSNNPVPMEIDQQENKNQNPVTELGHSFTKMNIR